jgi:uncharacterized protein
MLADWSTGILNHDVAMNLDELADYLMSDDSPDDCMMLSDLDGFIHGIACSPVVVPAEEWVPVALGGFPDDLPDDVLEAIIERYTEVVEGLQASDPTVEPIFWQAQEGHYIAMDWCEGFMQAVALRPSEWMRLTESGSHGFLKTPIMVHLVDDEGNSVLGIPQEELEEALQQAADAIPSSVVGIHQFWADQG